MTILPLPLVSARQVKHAHGGRPTTHVNSHVCLVFPRGRTRGECAAIGCFLSGRFDDADNSVDGFTPAQSFPHESAMQQVPPVQSKISIHAQTARSFMVIHMGVAPSQGAAQLAHSDADPVELSCTTK
jgi:hypothetical protein